MLKEFVRPKNLQLLPPANLKDEEPKPSVPGETVELKSASHFYQRKRKLVHKPVEPFQLFIDEDHALARLVWLYLLEVSFSTNTSNSSLLNTFIFVDDIILYYILHQSCMM